MTVRKDNPACHTCHQVHRSFFCTSCTNNNILKHPYSVLREDLASKETALTHLETFLTSKVARNAQQLLLQQRQKRLIDATSHVEQLEAQLLEVRKSAQHSSERNASRRSDLQAAMASLSNSRARVLGSDLPWALRYQDLTFKHLHSKLLLEQQGKLKQLLDILPIRISAMTSSSSATGASSCPVQITMCNLKLPDSLSPSVLAGLQPEATSSALGYTLQFLDLISSYLGGPLLHEGSFQGSTTVLWQQQSFWNRKPSSSNGVLPLFVEEKGRTKSRASHWAPPPITRAFTAAAAVVNSPSSPVTSFLSSSTSPTTLPTKSPPSNLSTTTTITNTQPATTAFSFLISSFPTPTSSAHLPTATAAANATSAATPPPPPPSQSSLGASLSSMLSSSLDPSRGSLDSDVLTRQRSADLTFAFELLQRSISCFVRDKACSLNLRLPPTWSPFGWLVVLCAVLRNDEGTNGVVAAAMMNTAHDPDDSVTICPDGHAEYGDRNGDSGWGIGLHGGRARGGRDTPEELEGWDVVSAAAVMPPLPSEPDEVEHWTRAMFTDANVTSHLLPTERIRSMFSR